MADLALVYNQKFGDTVTKNFKEFLETDLYVDLIFVCRNNVKIGAHQLVMSFMSKFFYEMFAQNGRTAGEKVIHVYVPDIRPKIMKHILEFVYCGKARMSKNELNEFNEDIKLLGMPLDVFTTAAKQSQSINVTGSNPGPVVSPSSVNSVVSPPSANSLPTTIPTTDISTAVTSPLPVNLEEPSKFPTHLSESDVSSSNLSVLPPGPLAIPTAPPIMPVIVATQSLNRSVVPNSQIEPSSNQVEPHRVKNDTSIVTRDSLPGTSSDSTINGVPSRKRRRLGDSSLPASECISLDSDDENEVIALS